MIKETKVWTKLRKLKNSFLLKRNYRYAKRLSDSEYENYLIERYAFYMNKHDYTKGKTLSFDEPSTFSEKSQWLKLYDQDPRKQILSDKYAVRKYVEKMIGKQYLIPIVTIDGKDCFNNANEIDFSKLPNQFVIKCNHGSHMNIVVTDKSSLSKSSISKIKRQLNKWLKIDYQFVVSLETQYKGIKPLIYIEHFINDPLNRDYKFLFFSGKCEYFWINENCTDSLNGTTTTFNLNYTKAPFNMNLGFRKDITNFKKPKNFDKMIEVAQKLADDFIFVRVDLYNCDGQIYFGEMTFNSASGYDVPYPEYYDRVLGQLMKIDSKKREDNYAYRSK